MIQPVSRTQPATPIHAIWPNGHSEEPGRVSPAEMAAEADFSRPWGDARATIAKITAAAAAAAAELPQSEAPAAPPRGAQVDLRA